MEEEKKFSYDAEFQTKILGCLSRLDDFNSKAKGLLKPQYFENEVEAIYAKILLEHYDKFGSRPDVTIIGNIIKEDIKKKIIKIELKDDLIACYKKTQKVDITGSEYVLAQISKFARYMAMSEAILKSALLVEKGDFEAVDKIMAEALQVGASTERMTDHDFFGDDEIEARMREKDERKMGLFKKAVKTGIPRLDEELHHKGWGKGELVSFLGLPKAGKSIGLAFFAKNATLVGHNVLFVTLEVSKEVTAERIESSITEVKMSELANHSTAVADKIKSVRDGKTIGKLIIEERPIGTLTPNELQEIVNYQRNAKGVEFDMIVVDYADIMKPNRMNDNNIENSKSIYVDLRAIAQRENVAVLTATQANREGTKAGGTLRMENCAEDFNKVRICDLMISINSTPEEKAANVARLFFAASRNQAGEKSIKISQDLETMNFVKSVIGIE